MHRRTLWALAAVIAVAACSSTATHPPPGLPAGASGPTAAPAESAPAESAPAESAPVTMSAAPSPVSPTAAPASAALVLGGSWVRPRSGARLSSYTATLSARPTATGPGETTFTKVVFTAAWSGAKKKLCTATKPGSDGTWSCKANLLELGVRPGTVTLSFDVHGEGVPAARSPDGARKVTYAVPPPRPTHAGWRQVDYDEDDALYVYRVRWSAPAGYADEFLVYETFECPRPATRANNNKPCFVPGTPVDGSQLELLAKAPGDARAVKVRFEAECFPSSILLRARNAYGRSAFAIVESAPVVWIDPNGNDIIC
jgi:hypothetical protein